MDYNGANRLARTLQKRMVEVNSSPPLIDFATIKSDLSLVPDSYDDLVIPKSDYELCISHTPCDGFEGCNGLSGCSGSDTCSGFEGCKGFKGCKGHKNWTPESGDRVVVAWSAGEIVVLGKINGG